METLAECIELRAADHILIGVLQQEVSQLRYELLAAKGLLLDYQQEHDKTTHGWNCGCDLCVEVEMIVPI